MQIVDIDVKYMLHTLYSLVHKRRRKLFWLW